MIHIIKFLFIILYLVLSNYSYGQLVTFSYEQGGNLIKKQTGTDSIMYVNQNSTDEGLGFTWESAKTDLKEVLEISSTCPLVKEIWVAEGTYYPSNTLDRDESFDIHSGLKMFGGFQGIEYELNQRDILLYSTTLNGDLAQDYYEPFDNSYHIVSFNNTDSTTTLDGFGIVGGYADGINNKAYGGGIFIDSDVQNESKPLIKNISFINNYAISGGGAIYNNGFQGNSSPTIDSCSFLFNSSALNGGSIHNNGFQGMSNPTISNSTFGNSTAESGGAIYNNGVSGFSNPRIKNNEFSNCSSTLKGGSISNIGSGGGQCNPYILGNVFINNSSLEGRDIYNNGTSGENSPLIINNTFYTDLNPDNGNIIYNKSSNYIIGNSILWGHNDPIYSEGGSIDSVYNSIVRNGFPGTNILIDDPLFIDTLNYNLRLTSCSPAINYGESISFGSDTLDIDGNNRPFPNTLVDIGAYEFVGDPFGSNNTILYVSKGGTGLMDGSSWANAYPELSNASGQNPCDSSIDTIWVSMGTYSMPDSLGREGYFQFRDSLIVLGGFSGNELFVLERDIIENLTIICGDIGIKGDSSDNAYKVLYLDSLSGFKIDGFTIQGGNANGNTSFYKKGSAITNINSQVILENISIINNNGIDLGSIMFVSDADSELVLKDVLIYSNYGNPIKVLLTNDAKLIIKENVTFEE